MAKRDGRWTANLPPAEKQVFEDLLGVNNKVLDRLVEICYNMVKSSEDSDTDFENPNWAYKQAHWLGYRKAMKQIIMLCTSKDDRS
jgi:hypothetical protein